MENRNAGIRRMALRLLLRFRSQQRALPRSINPEEIRNPGDVMFWITGYELIWLQIYPDKITVNLSDIKDFDSIS